MNVQYQLKYDIQCLSKLANITRYKLDLPSHLPNMPTKMYTWFKGTE